jgi:hypothetical protein
MGLDDLNDEIYILSLKGLSTLISFLIPKSEEAESTIGDAPVLPKFSTPEELKKASKNKSLFSFIQKNSSSATNVKNSELIQPALSVLGNIIIPHTLKVWVADDSKEEHKWIILQELIFTWKTICAMASKVSFLLKDLYCRDPTFSQCHKQF